MIELLQLIFLAKTVRRRRHFICIFLFIVVILVKCLFNYNNHNIRCKVLQINSCRRTDLIKSDQIYIYMTILTCNIISYMHHMYVNVWVLSFCFSWPVPWSMGHIIYFLILMFPFLIQIIYFIFYPN
jgi:hypothetical protein